MAITWPSRQSMHRFSIGIVEGDYIAGLLLERGQNSCDDAVLNGPFEIGMHWQAQDARRDGVAMRQMCRWVCNCRLAR